jgi:hypothetical protein
MGIILEDGPSLTTEETSSRKRTKPPQDVIDEVVIPEMSKDKFKIGDKEFKLKILPIAVEKQFSRSMSELLKSLNLDFKDSDSIGKLLTQKLDIVLIPIADLLIDLVYTIAKYHDPAITKEYIENNTHAVELFNIVVAQLKKQELLDIVVGFTKGMATLATEKAPSQQS